MALSNGQECCHRHVEATNVGFKSSKKQIAELELYLPNTDRDDDLLADDWLRMLFLCADPKLSLDSQISFALKVVAGFSIEEIARALLVSESTIQKRITRSEKKLRETCTSIGLDDRSAYPTRCSGSNGHLFAIQ